MLFAWRAVNKWLYTGWPVKHGPVFLAPCIKRLVQCTPHCILDREICPVYSTVYCIGPFFQATRKTLLCLTGDPVLYRRGVRPCRRLCVPSQEKRTRWWRRPWRRWSSSNTRWRELHLKKIKVVLIRIMGVVKSFLIAWLIGILFLLASVSHCMWHKGCAMTLYTKGDTEGALNPWPYMRWWFYYPGLLDISNSLKIRLYNIWCIFLHILDQILQKKNIKKNLLCRYILVF